MMRRSMRNLDDDDDRLRRRSTTRQYYPKRVYRDGKGPTVQVDAHGRDAARLSRGDLPPSRAL